MSQSEIKHIVDDLYRNIHSIIDPEFDKTVPIGEQTRFQYLLFIRVLEFFMAIKLLLDEELYAPAAAQIRAMAESYILLKAATTDKDFGSRYIKSTAALKREWIRKIEANQEESGFDISPNDFESIKSDLDEILSEHSKEMPRIANLFKDLGCTSVYLQIYVPACSFLHGDLQSFSAYVAKDSKIIDAAHRDNKGSLIHSSFSAALLLIESYGLVYQQFGLDKSKFQQLEQEFKAANDRAAKLRNYPD